MHVANSAHRDAVCTEVAFETSHLSNIARILQSGVHHEEGLGGLHPTPQQGRRRILKFHLNILDFMISNFHRVLNVVCFLLGNSPASEFYMPTFRYTLFHLHRQVGKYLPAYED